MSTRENIRLIARAPFISLSRNFDLVCRIYEEFSRNFNLSSRYFDSLGRFYERSSRFYDLSYMITIVMLYFRDVIA